MVKFAFAYASMQMHNYPKPSNKHSVPFNLVTEIVLGKIPLPQNGKPATNIQVLSNYSAAFFMLSH